MASDISKFGMDAAKIGGTGALASVLGELAMRRTNWSFAARGGAQAAVFCVSGLVLANKAPNLAMGLFTAGLIQGVRGVAQEWELQQFLSQSGASRGAVTSGTGTTGTGAGAAAGTAGGTPQPLRTGGALGPGGQYDPTASLFTRTMQGQRVR